MKDEFFGLRLNEQYTPIDAIDILRNNTGKTFIIEKDAPLRIVGHDIYFAGYSWKDVSFLFDYNNHLHEVRFVQLYYLRAPSLVSSPEYRHAEEITKSLFISMANALESKYGKPLPPSLPNWKSWKFKNKSVYVSTGSWYDSGVLLNKGPVDVFDVILSYSDHEATATSSDML